MTSHIGRRKFLATLGGAAAAWPLAGRAQQQAMPVVGFLSSGERGVVRQALAGFTDGLKETGYVEGQNVAVEYRFAEGQFDRFPALVSDLVHRGGGAGVAEDCVMP
jgi:putative ABC transport system substrate-binding protein